jgi:uncharacterized membrane protein YvlD (DUF360 family)
MLRLVVAWAINAAALWLADASFGGVHIHGWWAYLIGAGVTLGIFYFFLSIVSVLLAEWIAPRFSIDGFWSYVGVVVVVWLVNWVAHRAIDELQDRRALTRYV